VQQGLSTVLHCCKVLLCLCVAVCREIDLRTDKVYRVEVSYMEIYNEGLYDLLADNPAAADNLAILDDASNTVVRKRHHNNSNRAKQQQTLCMCRGLSLIAILFGPA
jgi:hypothetical protein